MHDHTPNRKPIRIKLKARSSQNASIPSSPIKRVKPNPQSPPINPQDEYSLPPLRFTNTLGQTVSPPNSRPNPDQQSSVNRSSATTNHKSIVINLPATLPILPTKYRDSTWTNLQNAIDAILQGMPLPDPSMGPSDLYLQCENLCFSNDQLYMHTQLKHLFDQHTKNLFNNLKSAFGNDQSPLPDQLGFVTYILNQYNAYTSALITLWDILLPLDSTFAVPNKKLVTWELGITSFSTQFLAGLLFTKPVLDLMIECSMSLVRQFRGIQQDQSILDVLKNVTNLLTCTHHYTTHFEPSLLTTSVTEYRTEANRFIQSISDPLLIPETYMIWVQDRLAIEQLLVDAILPKTKRKGLLDCILKEIVYEQRHHLLAGVSGWLCTGNIDYLHTLFGYLVRVNAIKPDLTKLVNAWMQGMVVVIFQTAQSVNAQVQDLLLHARAYAHSLHIVASSSATTTKLTGSKLANAHTIEDLLTLKVHMDRIIVQAFTTMRDIDSELIVPQADCVAWIKEACLAGLVDGLQVCLESRPAEGLAKYVDGYMRSKRTAKLNSNGGRSVIDHVMDVFDILKDKDTFLTFHKKHLARRLITHAVTSNDAERSLVARLAKERGLEMSDPINKMFDNVTESEALRTEFKTYRSLSVNTFSMELDVIVGQESVWPTDLSPLAPLVSLDTQTPRTCLLGPNVRIPTDLSLVMDTYTKFYATVHKGRALHWQLELGTLVVTTFYGKDLIASMDKALVLLAYNSVPYNQQAAASLSFEEIMVLTGIDPRVLRVTLQSLACTPKVRVLSKHVSDPSDEMKDVYTVLPKLAPHHTSVRIKLPSLVPKDVEELDAALTRGRVDTDRTGALDAAIVRVMKARKQVDSGQLFPLVTAQCAMYQFRTDLQMFQQRVSDLVDRDFLAVESTRGDGNEVYVYVP